MSLADGAAPPQKHAGSASGGFAAAALPAITTTLITTTMGRPKSPATIRRMMVDRVHDHLLWLSGDTENGKELPKSTFHQMLQYVTPKLSMARIEADIALGDGEHNDYGYSDASLILDGPFEHEEHTLAKLKKEAYVAKRRAEEHAKKVKALYATHYEKAAEAGQRFIASKPKDED